MKNKQKSFLRLYREQKTVDRACRAASVRVETLQDWLYNDQAFCAAFQQIEKELLEAELQERVHIGVPVPVVYKGEMTYRRCPDTGQILRNHDDEPIPLVIYEKSAELLKFALTRADTRTGDVEAPFEVNIHFTSPPDWDNVEWDDETGLAKPDDKD